MNLYVIYPEITVLLLALMITIIDLILPAAETRRSLGYISIMVLGGLFISLFYQYHIESSAYFYNHLFYFDNYAIFFKQLFLLAVILTILFSLDYAEKLRYSGEFYAMILFALIGMMVLASANDFLTMFIGLELMTVCFYALTGFKLDDKKSSEAGIKYLIIGSSSTAVTLYGISLIYGTAHSLSFSDITLGLSTFSLMGMAGMTMVVIGLFFKMSIIPFHMWAPDVYEGAPTPVTGLLAMGSKAAAIAVFIRILFVAFLHAANYFLPVLAVFSAICMIGGNIAAIKQKNIKRMLAYSSIAQAGYMMVGICAGSHQGMKAVMFYAFLYVLANVGAFAVLSVVDKQNKGTDYEHLSGLSQSAPVLAMVMAISLLSMAGIPPTAGFAGKLYLFTAVVEQGYLWLAFVGFIMSMISVYYYLKVVKVMYMGKPREKKIIISGSIRAVVLISAVATILFGIWPQYLSMVTNFASITFIR
ncbi:NADH-quinone oxidoreductase subunit N [Pectinatus sottacetonis]|uniref:NADH-quinone oxidoreductase subunit N n=1 Tax=Pectinatus sottacetonis TaxID=1002795 RepID=UPI0018C51236|nr:NADH-quinone oxidoreductase subunit N [Pectinatus sottacetonis]